MPTDSTAPILIVNAGSSSIKFSLFAAGSPAVRILEGSVTNIGLSHGLFSVSGAQPSDTFQKSVEIPDQPTAVSILTSWIKARLPNEKLLAVGHRIVHGGPNYFRSQLIDDQLIKNLHDLIIFDPEHLPLEIKLIEAFGELFPALTQVACFDTAFHHDLPRVAQILPIPRRYEQQGLRRYGFHGLSYQSILKQLPAIVSPVQASGRVVIAHLGSGVSVTAVHNGQSVDTSMGLTPSSGVPMSTRSGDIDPGLAAYLARSENQTIEQYTAMLSLQSGLLGVSETTADMEQLLAIEAHDPRAKEAIDLFCYQIRKTIGGLTAALGGLDLLVFTGGMGVAAPKIRARICAGLQFLNVQIDVDRNDNNNSQIISPDAASVPVLVLHTDEAQSIVDEVIMILSAPQTN